MSAPTEMSSTIRKPTNTGPTVWTPVHGALDKSTWVAFPVGARFELSEHAAQTILRRIAVFKQLEKYDSLTWSIRFADDMGIEFFTADVKADGWSDTCDVVLQDDAQGTTDRAILDKANLVEMANVVSVISEHGIRWIALSADDDEVVETPDLSETDIRALQIRG